MSRGEGELLTVPKPRAVSLLSVYLAVKPVGEPDAGDRHVRFDERGWETERCRMAQATAPILDSTSHPPRASARPSSIDARQIDWLAALMGMDSMPALMVIAADKELAIIFANQQANPVPQD